LNFNSKADAFPELLSYALTVGGIATVTLIPAYIALYLFANLKNASTKYLAALGLGLAFWFWTDTMGDAGYLDVNSAAYPTSSFGGIFHFLLITAFILGLVALAFFDKLGVRNWRNEDAQPSLAESRKSISSRSLIFIPVAVAAVMGIHGLGEGWDLGSAAVGVSSGTDFVSAFGGYSPLVSYPIHKFLEASIIGILYAIYVSRAGVRSAWHIPVLGLLFGLTSVIGAATGYYLGYDTTYFYAFGVTAAIYAAVRLTGGVLSGSGGNAAVIPNYLGAKTFLFIAIGFFLLYTAALLH
jgi:hypothetical protein